MRDYIIWLLIMITVGFVCAVNGVPANPYIWWWLGITYGVLLLLILYNYLKPEDNEKSSNN